MTGAARSPLRSWALNLGKLLLVAAAFWLVSTKITWRDGVETAEGVRLEGTIEKGFEPEAEEIVMLTRAGERVRLEPGEWKTGSKALGVRSAVGRLSLRWYLLGMAMIFAMYLLGVLRWQILLAAQHLEVGYARAFRLTFMGFFWNNFMPGMTGGDVAKAVLIARDHPGSRSEAVSTVIVDRLVGLAILAFIASLAILSNFEAFGETSGGIFAVLAGCALVAVCFLSRRVRRLIRLDSLLRRLPFKEILQKLDRAFLLYRSKPGAIFAAVVLSFLAHGFNIGSVVVFGHDLGIRADWLTYFATVPLVLITASIPLFPGGWGVRETAFVFAFAAVGVPDEDRSKVVILSLLLGLSLTAWSLLGGLFLFGRRREAPLDPDEFAAPRPT